MNGARFSLPWGVKRITRDSAMAIGLHDRGLVARGYKADLNVIDYDRLQVRAPQVVYDLPTGGRRLIQRADGYEATIVSGVTVTRNGEATGALARTTRARSTSQPVTFIGQSTRRVEDRTLPHRPRNLRR